MAIRLVRHPVPHGPALQLDCVFFVVEGDKALMEFLVRIPVARVDHAIGLWSEDSTQVRLSMVAKRCNECLHRFLGRSETPLRL
jgi:hypothetical protein